MQRVTFVVGVNGVGKSAVLTELRDQLTEPEWSLHDLDERGVPDNAGKYWRIAEARHWMTVAKENPESRYLVAGYLKPKELNALAHDEAVPTTLILLDADGETIRGRLARRYEDAHAVAELLRITGKTPEKFTEDNIWVSQKFREDADELGCEIIDTTTLSLKETAEAVTEIARC